MQGGTRLYAEFESNTILIDVQCNSLNNEMIYLVLT